MSYKLRDVCSYAKDRIGLSDLTLNNYISTENMLTEKAGVTVASGLPTTSQTSKYQCSDVLISNIRPYFKKIWYANKVGGCSNDVLVMRANEKYNSLFLYYVLSNDEFFNYATATAKGTKMPRGDKTAIMDYDVPNIPLEEQRQIARILSCLDDKVELNNKINDCLEQMAQAIFKSWFVDFEPFQDGEFEDSELGLIPKGWHVGNLFDIAQYLNGLAMQKFRPIDIEKGIPVLKIKELRQGSCDCSSDLCSEKIKSEYIINDGDVIFSWSGSLLVDFWCGGICGLNQHLFKVTSDTYNKWFYYIWTNYHLQKFTAIAADKATTMGHIKREDLASSLVLIPDIESYKKIGRLLEPIYEQIISNRIENRKLADVRDNLLPKLMSGKLSVSDLEAAK